MALYGQAKMITEFASAAWAAIKNMGQGYV
jgi:hypothetical protein